MVRYCSTAISVDMNNSATERVDRDSEARAAALRAGRSQTLVTLELFKPTVTGKFHPTLPSRARVTPPASISLYFVRHGRPCSATAHDWQGQ